MSCDRDLLNMVAVILRQQLSRLYIARLNVMQEFWVFNSLYTEAGEMYCA